MLALCVISRTYSEVILSYLCCMVSNYLGLYSQVTKSMRWMPRRQKAMKDVVVCDKPRGVDNKRYIRGFPNGETQPV